MATVLRYLLATIMLLQGAAGLRASEPSLNDQQLNQCLNFAFQQHISGVEDEWNKTRIDYAGALPSDRFEALALETQNQHCLISIDHKSFNRADGLLWALALHYGAYEKEDITSQLAFDELSNGEVFLLGYLISANKFEGTVIRQQAINRLDKLAEVDADAALKKIDVLPSLSQTEFDETLQRATDLGSQAAFIRQGSEEEVRSRLSDESYRRSLSKENLSRLIYFSCSQIFMEWEDSKTENTEIVKLCEQFRTHPTMALYQIFTNLNKPYGKAEILFAKSELFRFLEDQSLLAGNWLDEFTLSDQAAILLFQLFAHFGEDRTIFPDEEVERYLNLAVNKKVPINYVALSYYLSSLYRTYSIFDLDEQVRQQLEAAQAILSPDTSSFEQCKKSKELQFSKMNRWPVAPLLPIISSIEILDVEFLELESAAADQGVLRVFGQWRHIDPGFFDLAQAETADNFCQFNFVDSGKFMFPTTMQKITGETPLQREFTSELYNPEAAGVVSLTESEFVGTPRGEMIWGFEANQKIKLDTDLRDFPFSTKRTSIELGLVAKSSFVSFPALMSEIRVIEDEELLNEDDGNRFFARFDQDSLSDIKIEASLYVNLTYYILRIIAPVLIFVSLGLFTLLKARENTEAQLQVATTVMVALVAYQFVINSTLPKLPYLTLIDMFLLASVASSAFIILFNLVPHLEKKDTRVSEYLFMLSRVGGVGGYAVSAMILIYGLWLYAQS